MTRVSGILLLALVGGGIGWTRDGEFVFGHLRIQVLSKDLVRVEERGPKGFEDRPTLNVPYRPKPAGGFLKRDGEDQLVVTGAYVLRIPARTSNLDNIRVEGADWESTLREATSLPKTGSHPFVFVDGERVAVGAQGCDFENAARDYYLVGSDDLEGRRQLLKLTGGIPMPRASLLGVIYQQPGSMTQASLEEALAQAEQSGASYTAVAVPRSAERRSVEDWPSYELFSKALADKGIALLANEIKTESRQQIRKLETPTEPAFAGWITDDEGALPEALRTIISGGDSIRRSVVFRCPSSDTGFLSYRVCKEAGLDHDLKGTLRRVLTSGEALDPFRVMTLRDDGLTPEQRVRAEQLASLMPLVLDECMTPTWTLPAPYSSLTGAARLLRQRLLPLRYTLALETVRTGIPPLRTMAAAFPGQAKDAGADQFLLGEDLLAAPVLSEGVRQVWIPPGRWSDLWTGITHAGPTVLSVSPPVSQMPLFLREGAPIALGSSAATPGAGAWRQFDLVAVLPSEDGRQQRSIMEDDGQTMGFAKGKSQRTKFSLERRGNKAYFRVEGKVGDYDDSLRERDWRIHLHLPAGVHVSKVIAEGVVRDVERFRSSRGSAGILPLLGKGTPFTEGGVAEVTIPRQPGTYAFQIVFVLSQGRNEALARS